MLFLGANDFDNIRLEGRTLSMQSPGWIEEYGRRAGELMDIVGSRGARLYWVGMPVLRDGRRNATAADANTAVQQAAAGRPWVRFVDTWTLFADGDGRFATFRPGAGGEMIRMRQDDGIHLTRQGSNVVVAVRLRAHAEETGASPGSEPRRARAPGTRPAARPLSLPAEPEQSLSTARRIVRASAPRADARALAKRMRSEGNECGACQSRKRLTAEFIGTFWLVFGGCGSAVLAAAFPEVGIGFLGVALAFGLTVLTMAYAIGHISGCHLNPAVSARPRWPAAGSRRGPRCRTSSPRCSGASPAPACCYVIAIGRAGLHLTDGFAANGYGEHSPGQLLPGRLPGGRGRADLHVPDDHPGGDGRPGAEGLRPDRHRPRADPDPPDRDSGHQPLGQPGAQHRARRSSSAAGPWPSCGSSGSPP